MWKAITIGISSLSGAKPRVTYRYFRPAWESHLSLVSIPWKSIITWFHVVIFKATAFSWCWQLDDNLHREGCKQIRLGDNWALSWLLFSALFRTMQRPQEELANGESMSWTALCWACRICSLYLKNAWIFFQISEPVKKDTSLGVGVWMSNPAFPFISSISIANTEKRNGFLKWYLATSSSP